MPCILHIETATEVCSVVVSNNNDILFEKIETKGPSHAVLLGQFVDEAVKFLRSKDVKLDAVAVSCGPGSYTGLRIGVSEAKGLCYGMNIPLIALNTLMIMAHGVISRRSVAEDVLLCPMIDARRMEVYDMVLNHNMVALRDVAADIIDENSFSNFLSTCKVAFFGNGAAKCKEIIQKENAIFIDSVYPQASDMIALALSAYRNSDFVDVAYFEPFYLKEFVATTPKNKVLANLGK